MFRVSKASRVVAWSPRLPLRSKPLSASAPSLSPLLRYPHTAASRLSTKSPTFPARSSPRPTGPSTRLRPQARHCSCQRIMYGQDSGGSTATEREVLPTNVKPAHYDLTLEPDFDKFNYKGEVTIALDVKEDTTSITLNSHEVDIHTAKVSGDGVDVEGKISYDVDKQRASLAFDKSLPSGSKAKLTLTFTGILNDQMAGFYRSSFKYPDGKTGWMATTQFEATDARRAFPCFDEPALKATYTVTLVHDPKLTALSNMDEASTSEAESKIDGKTKKATTFNKSPLMSSYLLAFVVGELNYIETNSFRVPIRVYAPPELQIEQGQYALELAAKTLDFYEKTFDSKFPLPKMDMIAIPDFSAGAMENWGLVTYRSVVLMYDEATSGASQKERVAEVVQHELAHQWFGNLVTMDFWDGLWLNEGFATWMSWYSCNKFYPEWKVWQGYVTDNLQSALSLDSLRSSHPIEVPVNRADEINEIFDAISYSKGSAVIRMISRYLGEETFMEGIRRYLKKHAYGNTSTRDLWAALADASGKPVEKVMDVWTRCVGYPVLSVGEKQGGGKVNVRQNRCLKTGDVKPEDDQTLYPVFLGMRTREGVQEDLTLTERERDVDIPADDFFKFNADHSGIYRTNYTPERWAKLGKAAGEGLLSVEDRAGMVSDAGFLASAGYGKTSGVLGLLKGFNKETEFVVWSEIISRIGAIRSAWTFEDQKIRDALKAFQLELVAPIAHAKGWEFAKDEDHVQAQFKALLFGAAGAAGDEKVISAAKSMFKAAASGDRKAIHPNLRNSVYHLALVNEGEYAYDVLLNEYRTAKNADEKNSALRALGRAKDPKLIERAIELPLSDEVKGQDIYLPIVNMRSEPAGINALWSWLTGNWEAIKKKAPSGLPMLGTIVTICSSNFTHEGQLKQIDEFFDGKDKKGYEKALQQSKDSIRSKINWLERDADDVKGYLEKEGYVAKGEKLADSLAKMEL